MYIFVSQMFLKNVIYRLLQYRSCVLHFKVLGFQKIFSSNLANEAGVSSEQVRKDFSMFDIKGNKKAGYNIDELLSNLNDLLLKHKLEKVIIIGMGNIGKALAQYKGFTNDNIDIVGAFDIDPSKQNKSTGIPIYPLDKLQQVIEEHKVKIAIITVPGIIAQDVANLLISQGIVGILNFAPVILKVPDNVIVNNINLTNELNNLTYFININRLENKQPKV